MAARDELAALPPEQELAVSALLAAALLLPVAAAQELLLRVTKHLLIEDERKMDGRPDRAERSRRFIAAIHTVAKEVGRTPVSTDYLTVYKEHKARGETDMPSLSAVVKHFRSWPHALLAAGFGGFILPSRIERRRDFRPRRIAKYPLARLIECLHACARDLGRIPTCRDYEIWQEEAAQRNYKRGYPNDIAHYRTLVQRFGTWEAALAAAGFSTDLEDKVAHWEFSDVGSERSVAKTATSLNDLGHGRPHAAAERIERPTEDPLEDRPRDRRPAEAGERQRASDRAEAAAGGVLAARPRGRRRLVAVPDLTEEPVRDGA